MTRGVIIIEQGLFEDVAQTTRELQIIAEDFGEKIAGIDMSEHDSMRVSREIALCVKASIELLELSIRALEGEQVSAEIIASLARADDRKQGFAEISAYLDKARERGFAPMQ